MTGRNPFPGVNKAAVKRIIMTKEIDYSKPYLQELSADAINFIQSCLNRDIEKRASAKQLLNHKFITTNANLQGLTESAVGEVF